MENMHRERKVLMYPSVFKMHTSYRALLDHPPKGYRFVANRETWRARTVAIARNSQLARALYHIFVRTFRSTALLDMALRERSLASNDVDLIYSMGLIYKGDLPYVIEILDNPFSIAGYNYATFVKNEKAIKQELESSRCRRIICAHSTSLAFMKERFSSRVAKKCVLMRTAIDECLLPRIPHNGFSLVFVGSTTNPDDFYTKGGLEALNAFEKASKHHDISLVIRCKIPEELRERIKRNKKITIIEREIPFSELQKLYLSSDVFILPGHHFHLMAMLEAMSYGLPILALDTYAFKDYIKPGFNGFLIRKSEKIREYGDKGYPTNVKTREFLEAIKKGDERVVRDLRERIIFLFEHPRVLRRMSENSKKIIRAQFSIGLRNRTLKRVLDAALQTP